MPHRRRILSQHHRTLVRLRARCMVRVAKTEQVIDITMAVLGRMQIRRPCGTT